MGRINQYPKASTINDSDTLLGVVGGTTKQVAKDVLLSGVTNDISNTTIVGKKAGKVVTADDSSNNRLPEITAYGKSVQNTYSGKNKLDNTNVYNRTDTTGTATDTGVSVTGSWFAFYKVKVSANTDYTISYIKSGEGVNRCNILQSDVSTIIKSFVDNSGGTFNTGNNTEICIAFYSGTGTSGTSIYTDIQLELGTVATPFEKYVGGEPSPNPSYPQAITSVADDKSLVVKSVGKNLFMDSEIGLIDGNGNDVTNSNARRTPFIHCKEGDKFTTSKNIAFVTTSHNGMARFYDENKNFVKSAGALPYNSLSNTITIPSGVSYVRFTQSFVDGDYLDVEYQVERGDKATEYDNSLTEATLTLTDSLRGIPVTEGGNYTDEDGQAWICDTLEKYADGTGKYIKRVYRKVFDGTESEWIASSTVSGRYAYTGLNSRNPLMSIPFSEMLCTQFVYSDYTNEINKFCYDNNYNMFFNTEFTTLDEWKTHLANNPMTVIFQLATPIETDLTAAQMAELEKLMSFEPYTTVMTDDMGEIAITYFKNSDSGKIVGSLNDRISNLVALLQSNGVI